MAGTTPNLELPYPDLTDSADVPRDIKALADAVDDKVNASGEIQSLAPVAGQGFRFTSIPTTSRHLRIEGMIRNAADVATSGSEPGGGIKLYMTFNGDTTTSAYGIRQLDAKGGSGPDGANVLHTENLATHAVLGDVSDMTTAIANAMTSVIIEIPNFHEAFWKMWFHRVLRPQELTPGTPVTPALVMGGGVWRNIAPITEVKLMLSAGQFSTDSRCTLYGE